MSTSLPSTFHRFMETPVEIRLLIYNELMAHDVHLYRAKCYLCVERAKNYSTIDITNQANLVSAQILRTSKQIYSEALPVVYSKNTVHMKCLKCEKEDYQCPRSDPLWACSVEKIGIESFHPHVKHVAFAYAITRKEILKSMSCYQITDLKSTGCFPITEFPARWPLMEHQILAIYKNTERISISIRLCFLADITIDLVRRSCKSKPERVYDYKSVIAEHGSNFLDFDTDEISLQLSAIAFEEMYEAITLSHARGELKDTVFAVQSIRWKRSGNKPIKRPEQTRPEQMREIILNLGFDKHSPSDTSIEEILARQSLRVRGEGIN